MNIVIGLAEHIYLPGSIPGNLGLIPKRLHSFTTQLQELYGYNGFELNIKNPEQTSVSVLTLGTMPPIAPGYSIKTGLTLPLVEVENKPGKWTILANEVLVEYTNGRNISLDTTKSKLVLDIGATHVCKF